MEKNTSVATLQMVGGRACLDFANTVVARRDRWGPDLLADYGDLAAWAERAGVMRSAEAARLRELAARQREASAAALGRAKDLREALFRLFSSLAAGRVPPESDLARLTRATSKAQARRRLVRLPEGGFAWRWPDYPDLDEIALRVAHDAADLLTDPLQLERVKECPGRNCGWLFLDTSRNARRRWCSDADCGTRERVTRHRARHRASLSSA